MTVILQPSAYDPLGGEILATEDHDSRATLSQSHSVLDCTVEGLEVVERYSGSSCDSTSSDEDSSSCSSFGSMSSSDSDSDSTYCGNMKQEKERFWSDKEDKFALVETLPAPTHQYKVICLSFFEEGISSATASKVTKESLRMLKPGGLLYVVDATNTVEKLPGLRQMVRRVEYPTVRQTVHEIETTELLLAHGFDANPEDAPTLKRWMGIKPV